MEQIKRTKIVLLNYFSNSIIREHLEFDSRRLANIARKLLGLYPKGKPLADIAPWDTHMIEYLSKRDDVDLYVIDAHPGLKKQHYNFDIDNVHYHILCCDRTNFKRHLFKNESLWIKTNGIIYRAKKICRKIQPDIVVLVGVENAFISSAILGLEKYPRFVLLQTIYNNPQRKSVMEFDKKCAYNEKLVFERNHYFAALGKMHRDMLLQFQPNAKVFKWTATTPYPQVKELSTKKFDFVNFALTLDERKGAYDAIKAINLVRQKYPDVKLSLTGGCSIEDRKRLKQLITELGVENNVIFTPFFQEQKDLFQHLKESRFAVLPCMFDYISTTMLQAMHYELPTVVYKTEGTPTINAEKECVLIANNGDWEELAEKMLLLMDKPALADQLKINAKEYSGRANETTRLGDEFVTNCEAIINEVKNGIPIPEYLFPKFD